MTYRADKDPDFVAAKMKLHEAIDSLAADILAPRECAHGDWDDCEECSYSMTKPKQGYMLDQWVLVANMEPIDDRDAMSELVVTTPPRMRIHSIIGMLAYARALFLEVQ